MGSSWSNSEQKSTPCPHPCAQWGQTGPWIPLITLHLHVCTQCLLPEHRISVFLPCTVWSVHDSVHHEAVDEICLLSSLLLYSPWLGPAVTGPQWVPTNSWAVFDRLANVSPSPRVPDVCWQEAEQLFVGRARCQVLWALRRLPPSHWFQGWGEEERVIGDFAPVCFVIFTTLSVTPEREHGAHLENWGTWEGKAYLPCWSLCLATLMKPGVSFYLLIFKNKFFNWITITLL